MKEAMSFLDKHRKYLVLGATALVSASAGAAGAYIFTKKGFEAVADAEIAKFKAEYWELQEKTIESRIKARENEALKGDISQYGARLSEMGYTGDAPAVGITVINEVTPEAAELLATGERIAEAIEENRNIFTPEGAVPILEQEVDKESRDINEPYIITKLEYFENDNGYSQNVLTYYEGDGVLADEQEEHIPEIEKTIGEGNLKFGHGSGDENVVYIRNHKMQLDFEVIRNTGEYKQEVLGFIKHSGDKPRLRKFRDTD